MESWLEALDEAIVSHCLGKLREEIRRGRDVTPFVAMDCYLELWKRAKSGDVMWAERLVRRPPPEPAKQRALELLANIISDALDEYVDSCRKVRGWERYICADFTASYINKTRSELVEAIGEKAVEKAIAELNNMRGVKKIG